MAMYPLLLTMVVLYDGPIKDGYRISFMLRENKNDGLIRTTGENRANAINNLPKLLSKGNMFDIDSLECKIMSAIIKEFTETDFSGYFGSDYPPLEYPEVILKVRTIQVD